MRKLEFITRQDCHLCETAKVAVLTVAQRHSLAVETFDVDGDPALQARYRDHVPVVLVDGRVVAYWVVDPAVLERAVLEGPESISVRPL